MKKFFQIFFIFFLLPALLPIAFVPGQARAMENPAGRIHRMEGIVIITREYKTLNGSAGLTIYASDEIKTGPDSLVELILQDGSSLHMGPDSQLDLRKFQFSLGKDRPSFLARMAKGIFVYISGAISKVHPGAVQFDTPDATIGIRGTKLVVRADDHIFNPTGKTDTLPEDCRETIVVLFRDPAGNVGSVAVANDKGSSEVNKEFYAVSVKCDLAPSEQKFMDRATLEKLIPESLWPIVFGNYQPPLPYTPANNPVTTPFRPVKPPQRPKTFSESSP